jgi:hypothetical protein
MTSSTSSPNQPNLFQLHGRHLQVTYATTSFDGKARFTYHDATRTLSLEGDEIRVTDAEIGELVSVTIVRTVDSGSTSFTLLVPQVNLDQTNSAPISTEGITTIHRFSLVPAFNHGQIELYQVERLSGTARFVIP